MFLFQLERYINTLVKVKAPENTYNALLSAFFSAPELENGYTNSHYNVCLSMIQLYVW